MHQKLVFKLFGKKIVEKIDKLRKANVNLTQLIYNCIINYQL